MSKHFLLVFDQRQQLTQAIYEYDDAPAATTAYDDIESIWSDDPHMEVVLLGADSVDTLRATHGHYFGGRK